MKRSRRRAHPPAGLLQSVPGKFSILSLPLGNGFLRKSFDVLPLFCEVMKPESRNSFVPSRSETSQRSYETILLTLSILLHGTPRGQLSRHDWRGPAKSTICEEFEVPRVPLPERSTLCPRDAVLASRRSTRSRPSGFEVPAWGSGAPRKL